MNNFKKPFHRGASAGPRSFSKGGRPSFARPGFRSARPGPNEEREMFSATCNKCREACEVPFRPNGKKPVYCRNCFVRDEVQAVNGGAYNAHGAGAYAKREFGAERSFARPPADDGRIAAMAKELSAVHAKLDELIARLEG